MTTEELTTLGTLALKLMNYTANPKVREAAATVVRATRAGRSHRRSLLIRAPERTRRASGL